MQTSIAPNTRMTLWGDGHTHSDWSDGFDPLARNTELFRRYDQDFHVAADHVMIDVSRPGYQWEMSADQRRVYRLRWEQLAEYQAECRAACVDDHLTIDGLELTWQNSAAGDFGATDRAHVLVRDHIDRLPEPDFFRGRSIQVILRELKDREMKPFLAHISDGLPYDDFDGSETDGIEVHWDLERARHFDHRGGMRHWDRWLSQGHRVSLTGGSDSHQMDLWAASGARNVVNAPEYSVEAIRRALLTGHGYMSATWHPDLYAANGYPGNSPEAATRFSSWFRMEGAGKHNREAVRDRVERMIAATLDGDAGRAARSCYPTIDATLDGRRFGETAEARDDALLQLAVTMTTPVRAIRVYSQGAVVWQLEPEDDATNVIAEARLPLGGCRYLRIEADGCAGERRDEYLISNPIYLAE